MQFTSNHLATAVDLASLVISRRPAHEVLKYGLLTTHQSKASLVATNLSEFIEIKFDANCADSDTALAQVAQLKAILKKSKKEVNVTLTVGGISVSLAGTQSTVSTFEITEFPKFEFINTAGFLFDSKRLLDGLNAVAFSASTDPTKQILTSIDFQTTSDGVMLATTDGHRLTTHLLGGTNWELPHFNLPASCYKTLTKLLKLSPQVTLSIGSETALFTFATVWGRVRYETRLQNGQYPDYEKLIKLKESERTNTVTLARVPALEALKTQAALAKAAKYVQPVTQIQPHTNGINSKLKEIDCQIETKISNDHQTSDKSLNFNLGYLIDALTNLTTEKVNINYPNDCGIALICGVGNHPMDRGVLMPVRVKE